jgi:hypothetical protein
MKKDNAPAQNPKGSKSSKSLKDRVQKHLKDKNDVITEEDMKNIKVGDDENDEDPKNVKEFTESLQKKKVTTPWDVLTDNDDKE